jgi:hypothetical protein
VAVRPHRIQDKKANSSPFGNIEMFPVDAKIIMSNARVGPIVDAGTELVPLPARKFCPAAELHLCSPQDIFN